MIAVSDVVPDLDKFRLRTFVQHLAELGEVELHEQHVPLSAVSAISEASRKATLFKTVGKENFEIVVAVSGGRRRLAAAFGVDERRVAHEYMRRLDNPQPVVEIPPARAPVHDIVQTGEQVNLSRLPFHLQHQFDGGPYISSALDFTVDPATGRTNVGCRRLMLRGYREMYADLNDASDMRAIYVGCHQRGERLPVSYVVGCHPLYHLAAASKHPVDEFGLVATLRGEPLPMVRGITNGVLAPDRERCNR